VSPDDVLVQPGHLGVLAQLGLPAAARALALLLQRGLEAGSIHANAVLRGQLNSQVDGESVRVMQPEGDLAGQDG
jgi:hypothetical protein